MLPPDPTLPRFGSDFFLVRMRGLEPPRCHHHRLLRPARLPVPPHPLIMASPLCECDLRSVKKVRVRLAVSLSLVRNLSRGLCFRPPGQANSLSYKFVKSASDCDHKTCLHELDVHVGFCRNERFGSACFASSFADGDLDCPSAHREHHGSSQTCRTCCPTSHGCCPDRCPTSHYRDHDLVPVLKRHLLTTSSREQKQPRPAL